MTIRTKVTVGGVEVTDYLSLTVNRNTGKINDSSNFNMLIDSPFGRHSTDFTVGNEVKIFADEDAAPTTNIFTGILETKKFRGRGMAQQLVLMGRDFTARLMDITVEPVVFTNTEISQIVTTILSSNSVPDITINNVNVTPTTLERISFNHDTIFNAVKELSELSGFTFYVDEDKDLHFEQEGSSSSGITLDNTNILNTTFDESRKGMANKIWVYGDRYLAGFKEIFNADGGSVYTLLSKPHNTTILEFGSTLKGGVKGMTTTDTSGADFLVNFFDRQIEFLSGTSIGYNSIPASGGSFVADYQRELPVVKVSQNDSSIATFGQKNLVVVDKSIRDPATALDLARQKAEDADPLKSFRTKIRGWFLITPGNTVKIVLDDFNISETAVDVIGVSYRFDRNTIQSGEIITLNLSKKFINIADEIKDLKRRLGTLESSDAQSTDVITRLIVDTANIPIVGSYWAVSTRELGSSFIIGTANSNPGGIGHGGVLGSVVASGINFLGDSRTALTVQFSGGES